MASSLRSLSEQILRLHYGGTPPRDARVLRQEIDLLVSQVVNNELKLERFENLNQDSPVSDMPSCMIAEYEVEVVVGSKEAALPAQPISLPMGMGVWHISALATPDDAFIPIMADQFALIKNLDMGTIQGNTAYSVSGSKIRLLNKVSWTAAGVPAAPNNKLLVKLLISAINISTPDAVLPIPADMEARVIIKVRELLAPAQKKDVANDGQEER